MPIFDDIPKASIHHKFPPYNFNLSLVSSGESTVFTTMFVCSSTPAVTFSSPPKEILKMPNKSGFSTGQFILISLSGLLYLI